MQVTINGERKEIGKQLTISGLIAELGIDPTLVAVEQNGEIVPKSIHANTPVTEGDTLELVRFIGGG